MAKFNNNNNQIDLTNLFESIIKEIEKAKINNINKGGCGWFCYFLIKNLRKFGIQSKIARIEDYGYFNHWKDGFENFKNSSDENQFYYNEYLTASHFMVKMGRTFVDGKKQVNLNKAPSKIKYSELDMILGWGKVTGYYTLEDIKLALKHGSWNSTYDTKHNKNLEKIINKECCNFFENLSYSNKKVA